MTARPHHFKGFCKEPGEQSPSDPVHPEDFCEEIDCDNFDWDAGECRESHMGFTPDNCPETPMDKETYGDIEYHRKADEGEV